MRDFSCVSGRRSYPKPDERAEWDQRRILNRSVEDGIIQAPVQNRNICSVMSFSIAVCWRCISALQKPRAAPAHEFAALIQRLNQGLGMRDLSLQRTNA